MKNEEVAKMLYLMSIYLEMDEAQFKPRAYEKAADSIEALEKDVMEIYREGGIEALMEIPGIGEGIAEKIKEYILTGKVEELERLKKKVPVDVEGLMKIEGVGPKRIKMLYKKLNIKSIEDLEKAAKGGKIRGLEGFGEKSEQNILRGIEFVKRSKGRLLLGNVLPIAREIEKRLGNLKEVKQIMIAGSLRRRKETIGDIDILVTSNQPSKVMDFFVKMPEVVAVYGRGHTKSTVRLKIGCDADLRVVPPESFGAASQYFTGNVDHNVALRRIAISKGWKLSEYGIFKGSKQIAGKTEEEVYKTLGLKWIPPELRENTGEVDAARKNKLPKLIEYGSLKGDLQIQTKWTDGANSIKEMAEEAKRLRLKYIAITDHTKRNAFVGGLDEKQILKQKNEIDKVNKEISGLTVLSGSEVDILKNGELDISDKVLSQLEVVGASVHSNFNLSKEEQTNRIIKAMENENVDILFHPTGRLIQQREPYDVDIEKIIQTAKNTGTILEINSFPSRLDLKDEHIKLAVGNGVKLVIDSDAHNKNHIHYLEFGIAQARRGWAEKKDVINTKPLKEFLKMMK